MNLFSEVVGTKRPRDQPRVTQHHHGDAGQQARQEASFQEVAGQALVPPLALLESKGILAPV